MKKPQRKRYRERSELLKKKKQKTFTRHRNQEIHRERISQKTLTWTKNHEKSRKNKEENLYMKQESRRASRKSFAFPNHYRIQVTRKACEGHLFQISSYITKNYINSVIWQLQDTYVYTLHKIWWGISCRLDMAVVTFTTF